MIDELSISDLGVIRNASLPLGAGFTAITGETGAGKTMVVTALGLLLGARADAGSVRSGANQARVQGVWSVDDDGPVAERVRDAGGRVEDGELILGRTVSSEGRSRAAVGGGAAPAGVLAELAGELVVLHGQSDQQRLRSASAQREVVDRFAGEPGLSALKDYQEVYRRLAARQNEYDTIRAERDQRQREAMELRLAVEEIAAVAPQEGEDIELTEKAERLTHAEALREATGGALEALSSDSLDATAFDARALVDRARRDLEKVVGFDPALAPIVETVSSVGFLLDDVVTELSGYLAGLDIESARELEQVQERRSAIASLIRKYGPEMSDVIALEQSAGKRLFELDSDDERVEELSQLIEEDKILLAQLAGVLSERRASAGAQLADAVSQELTALAMPDAKLVVSIQPLAEPALHGNDEVMLLLQPHPGSEPRALSKGASGGELSRIMLAIEVVVAGADPVPTFVFDEVDSGVGGSSAIEIGKRLARLAQQSQVIVVTHLAQVAAFANNHLQIVKDSSGGYTESSVRVLRGPERAAEIARLLSGLSDSESALSHARELLDMALPR
ncbi:DNA repair protein RecN [Lysinibacter sp. HNR]|uniref:DNA repair protein RecN n=1 Tax=Lysinibacter sp. HNR TaxID=3031408 RepID=UPI002435C77B|nr:DNA repair protein RecN [Lysinibacter sp. HNR]WGD36599.1 DNA repair protein RecN [Lysinibacter sp. HNR]